MIFFIFSARRLSMKRNVLFVGNPGSGKSSLLNSILKKVIFQSGVVIGSGLTFRFDKHEEDGVVYMDTPGLSDTKKRKQAAAAITQALKQTGEYRIFFILTLENGRLRPDDVYLLKLILESAQEDLTSYSLVLNQIIKTVKRKLKDEAAIYQMLLEGGIPQQNLPKGIHVLEEDMKIRGFGS